jgi:HemY protein
MTEDHATRIAGLRGLYIEAEREGEHEAARQIAERAREEAPSAPWAARALLRHQTAAGDWDGALRTLSGAAEGRILDKRTARRQRAVILTAKAMQEETGNPGCRPAGRPGGPRSGAGSCAGRVVAGRLLSRQGDIRRATRVLEAGWKAQPHPEIADAYLHVRAGDSAGDRLKRAETLMRLRPQADEGRIAVARAAIDARDFDRVREVLTPVLTNRPTQTALFVMADLVESETGDAGRAREWMARAVRAPRDPAWTADGTVLEHWAPASPVTGQIDAVEWKVPGGRTRGAAPADRR